MRLGSMFTGYGGLDMAANAVFGSTTAWHCEIDKGASKLLEYRFPHVPNYGDVTVIDWSTVEPVEVLTAGFPCQPISNAGMRRGKNDARWLWPEVTRAISALRPSHVLLENVAAFINRGLSDCLTDLASLGFDAEWGCYRASASGAPHQRERWFCYATPADSANERGHRGGRHGNGGPNLRTVIAEATQDANRESRDEWRQSTTGETQERWSRGDARGRNRVASGFDWPPEYRPAIELWEHITGRAEPGPVDERGRVTPRFVEWMMGLFQGWVTEVPGLSRAQMLRLLGNGVVPQQAEFSFRIFVERAEAA